MGHEQEQTPFIPQAEGPLTFFHCAASQVIVSGGRRDLVSFVTDHPTGERRVFTPFEGSGMGNRADTALTSFLSDITVADRTELEAGILEQPDWVRHESHRDISRWEWQSLRDRLTVGVEITSDDRGEWVRTWYVRGQGKPRGLRQLLSGLFRRLGR